jgi:TRAP-type C4-dicarboxylate transport system permease small subunit
MEPDIVAFLKRVALSIFFVFCWLAINVIIGVRFDLAEVEGHITIGNVLYYIWLVGSLIVMLFFFLRMWRQVTKF